MHQPLTPSEKQCLVDMVQSPRTEPPLQRAFDAIWAGRDDAGTPRIRGFLQVTKLQAIPKALYAWTTSPDQEAPLMRCIPWEEVVWLLHGSSAPLLHARVPEEDPVLSLPGEDDAFRLRCLAKVDPVAMVRPTELIGLLPGFDLSTRLRSPASEKMFCGYQDRRQSPKLVVEYHDHGLGYRESSAGFSLAIWFLSKKDKDVRTLDWREVPRMELEQFAPFLHVFNVYQALRLPGLRLLLELRANRLPKEVFMRQFADEHKLPLSLVARRMHDLAGRERELTWF